MGCRTGAIEFGRNPPCRSPDEAFCASGAHVVSLPHVLVGKPGPLFRDMREVRSAPVLENHFIRLSLPNS
ncbi:MAG: hypothetical protein E5Y10_27460 [Mesorhizobium sp.]|nr:MAG: hypothetical protein EOS06_13150 [Mesorhizobium sp.]RWO19714.1 MAG: hypothetical protein EOS09_30615 [Mesorhizobium sp.]RWO53188.1 MAG: hypothetical protein EOS13_10530 [Mesorhizobium sp.]RWO60912.1 MAG: hypothetical protein EOS14_06120 [Mesorhizobium sp.]TIN25200.1 MAG: hypothetical protein E5Y19_18785 [Mesorhizobium sp.]